MTEPSPERELAAEETAVAGIPKWVPILIGVVLVSLAALAVYTGLRYREPDTLTTQVQPQRADPSKQGSAPPGEPDAGASRVLHGERGEPPPAHEAVAGDARAVITGGPGGVQATVRIWVSRGMMLKVAPSDSMVYVNNLPIGQASQFDTEDEVYDFAEPGSYDVKVVANSGVTRTFVVTVRDDAQQDVAVIEAAL